MVWDTTMSTAPTYTTLLNSPSSSEEKSPSPGKPPSNQTVLCLSLDHGGLKHPTMTYTPMDESKEDETSEVDLIDQEQEEESTVVIPSLPTVQEIT